MLDEGVRAPSFTLPDHHGKPVSLEDFSGRWLILWWYVRASTSG